MNDYRYQLERYRGVSTRYTCPQCRRKHAFTRYIDTENNNQYLSDNVGKCNRLDKCGYHYTPREYFTDNPHKRDREVSSFSFHREKEETKLYFLLKRVCTEERLLYPRASAICCKVLPSSRSIRSASLKTAIK